MKRRAFLTALGLGSVRPRSYGQDPAPGTARVRDPRFGATGDGRTDDGGAVRSALASLPPDGGTLLFEPGTYRVGSDLRLPRRVVLSLDPGAVLRPDAGVTLRLGGPLDAWPRRIFDGPGGLRFDAGSVEVVLPEWWGAVPDGETDSTAPLARALSALDGEVSRLRLAPGTYALSGPITLARDHSTIEGRGATLLWTADSDGLRVDARHVEIADLTVRGPGFGRSSSVGLQVGASRYWPTTTGPYTITGLHVIGWGTGVRLLNLERLEARGWKVDYNRRNLEMLDGAFNTFVNCRFSDSQGEFNTRLAGARGVGGGGSSNHNVFQQCEWLNTRAGTWALTIGDSDYPSHSNLVLKCDIERASEAGGITVRGMNNLIASAFFHDLETGLVATGNGDTLLLHPRFSVRGFGRNTVRAEAGHRLRVVEGTGLGHGRGAARAARG
jgi:hypothetical protein